MCEKIQMDSSLTLKVREHSDEEEGQVTGGRVRAKGPLDSSPGVRELLLNFLEVVGTSAAGTLWFRIYVVRPLKHTFVNADLTNLKVEMRILVLVLISF